MHFPWFLPSTRRVIYDVVKQCPIAPGHASNLAALAPGRGNSSSPGSPQQPGSTSSPATTQPAPANGTRSNTDSSPGSPTTGADNHSRHIKPSSILSPTPRPRPVWPHTANSIPIPIPPKSNPPTSRGNPYTSLGTNFMVTGIALSDHLTSIPGRWAEPPRHAHRRSLARGGHPGLLMDRKFHSSSC